MPELPEVQTVVSELHRKLKNRKIVSIEVRKPKIVSIGPKTVSNIRQADKKRAKEFAKLLAGQKIVSVSRRAKMLIFDLSGPLSMFVHLKMTGQFIFEDKMLRKKTGGKYRILNRMTAPLVQLPCKYTHVIFTFSDGSTLYYNDLRQFGYLKVVRDDEINQIKELNEYGPEPLNKKFSVDNLKRFTNTRKKITVKQYLMDPKVVVGIGNIYSDEILFHAKIAPDRRLDTLDNKDWQSIFKHIRPVLEKGIQAKGSSVGDFVRTDGTWGQMGKHHYVYGRKGQKCKKCGTIITSMKLGGRTASFCPNCQK